MQSDILKQCNAKLDRDSRYWVASHLRHHGVLHTSLPNCIDHQHFHLGWHVSLDCKSLPFCMTRLQKALLTKQRASFNKRLDRLNALAYAEGLYTAPWAFFWIIIVFPRSLTISRRQLNREIWPQFKASLSTFEVSDDGCLWRTLESSGSVWVLLP